MWGALRAYLSVNEYRDEYVGSFSCILLVASNVEMWEKIYHINCKCIVGGRMNSDVNALTTCELYS